MKKMFKISMFLVISLVFLSSCKKKPITTQNQITFDGLTNFVMFKLTDKQIEINEDGGLIVLYLNDETMLSSDSWFQIPGVMNNNVIFSCVNHVVGIEINARKLNEAWFEYPFNGPKTFNVKAIAIPSEKKSELQQAGFKIEEASYDELSAKL